VKGLGVDESGRNIARQDDEAHAEPPNGQMATKGTRKPAEYSWFHLSLPSPFENGRRLFGPTENYNRTRCIFNQCEKVFYS
jgi:hypothetical protein